MSTESEFVPTGIKGVDELLEGKGLPIGSTSFLLGSPGSGKTTFGLEFLYRGIKNWNQNGVYLSLDEETRRVKRYMRKLNMDLEPLEKEKKLSFIDAAPINSAPGDVKLGEIVIGKRDFTLISLIDMVKTHVKRVNAKRVVIDPIVAFTLQFSDDFETRTAILNLMQGIAETGATALIISELAESSIERTYQIEEYLAQGVILMRKITGKGGTVNLFTVEKMRGVDHDTQPHPYRIKEGGIEVYSSEIAF